MQNLVSGEIGLIHLIAAGAALISGTLVILWKKGTSLHKKMGYVYAVTMALMLITSFLLYNFFGRFALFHYLAVLSTLTLLGGLIPAFTRKKPTWVVYHFSFMYWSLMGLYAAFVAEILTRVPETPFYGMLGFAIFGVMSVAYFFWFRYKTQWTAQFLKSAV